LATQLKPPRNAADYLLADHRHFGYGPKHRFDRTEKTIMSRAFLAGVLQESADLTGVAATRAAGDLMDAVIKELKKNGKFTLPGFGTFTVRKTKARTAQNPRTGETIKVKAGKTVRFKASPTLKHAV
jgi:DNA-binding protein HU-beta